HRGPRWLVTGQQSIPKHGSHPPKNNGLPGRLRNPRDLPPQGQPTETQAANAELAQISARPAADLAAVVFARGKLGFSRVLNSFRCSCHLASRSQLPASSNPLSASALQ